MNEPKPSSTNRTVARLLRENAELRRQLAGADDLNRRLLTVIDSLDAERARHWRALTESTPN